MLLRIILTLAAAGESISGCAQQLGQRDDPPTVTCRKDGMEMTFATLGAMVAHMRDTGC